MKQNIEITNPVPLEKVSVQQALASGENLSLKAEQINESVTTLPDGKIVANRVIKRIDLNYGNANSSQTSVGAIYQCGDPAPQQRLLSLGAPVRAASKAQVDWKKVSRWGLSANAVALWAFSGGLDWKSLIGVMFEPLGLIQSAGALAGLVAAKYQMSKHGGGGAVGRAITVGALATAALPLMPFSDALEGPVQIVRVIGLPSLAVWSFLPVLKQGRELLRRLSSSPGSEAQPAQLKPMISLSSESQPSRALEILKTFTQGAASLLPGSSVSASAPEMDRVPSVSQEARPNFLPAGQSAKSLPSPASTTTSAPRRVRSRVR